MSRRRQVKVILLVVAVSIIVGRTSRMTLRPGDVQKLSFLSLQASCMNYDPPANYPVLVYSYPPVAPVPPLVPTEFKFVQRAPLTAWEDYRACIGQTSFRLLSRETATLFLHSLTSKSGHFRLVAVDLCYSEAYERDELVVTIVEPGTFSAPARIIYHYHLKDLGGGPSSNVLDSVCGSLGRFFAGHHDPIAPSHFTISFNLYGKTEILDGWLRDDDLVNFKVRDADKALERVRARQGN